MVPARGSFYVNPLLSRPKFHLSRHDTTCPVVPCRDGKRPPKDLFQKAVVIACTNLVFRALGIRVIKSENGQ